MVFRSQVNHNPFLRNPKNMCSNAFIGLILLEIGAQEVRGLGLPLRRKLFISITVKSVYRRTKKSIAFGLLSQSNKSENMCRYFNAFMVYYICNYIAVICY